MKYLNALVAARRIGDGEDVGGANRQHAGLEHPSLLEADLQDLVHPGPGGVDAVDRVLAPVQDEVFPRRGLDETYRGFELSNHVSGQAADRRQGVDGRGPRRAGGRADRQHASQRCGGRHPAAIEIHGVVLP